jgi:S1-C subfamily serine protease
MKRFCIAVSAALLTVAWAIPAVAQPVDTSKVLSDLSEKAKTGLAILTYSVQLDSKDPNSKVTGPPGMAVCIDPKGIFLTQTIDARFGADALKDFKLIFPGVANKEIDAKLVGVDMQTGIGFVQAMQPMSFSDLKFATKANVAVGQPVFSVGLFGGAGNTPYVGMGYVSATISIPDHLVYVTGGSLTTPGSPVLSADGKVIGIVGRQLNLSSVSLNTPEGKVAQVPVQNAFESSFFVPVDEFAHVLKSIPSDGQIRRPPWIGVNRFDAVVGETAGLMGLDANNAAVMALEVILGEPADKVGVKERDVITAINGAKIEKLANENLTIANFVNKLRRLSSGEKVKLTVFRDRQFKDYEVTASPMPITPGEAKASISRILGLAVREKTQLDFQLDKGPTGSVQGLIVVDLQKDGPAEAAGLQRGGIITMVDDKAVSTADAFKTILDDHVKNNRMASVRVAYQGPNQSLPILVMVKIPPPTTATAPAK